MEVNDDLLHRVAVKIYQYFRDTNPKTVFCWDELTEEEKGMFNGMARAALSAVD